MSKKIIFEPSRTLAEFRLLPGFTTMDATIEKISLQSRLANFPHTDKPFSLNIPLVAAAMQSVSGSQMAIELARQGGTAFIYSSQSSEQQAQMVSKVKNHKAGFVKPYVISPDMKISELSKLRAKMGFSTFPVVNERNILLGMITRNDFAESFHENLEVRERMIPRENLSVGVNIASLKHANELLIQSHHGVLPIVNEYDELSYLVFRKDIQSHLNNPNEIVDERKRLISAAAINTRDFEERVPMLVKAGVDVIAIDSSDGHSVFQKRVLEWVGKQFPQVPLIGGNIITAEGFDFLVEAGAQAVKVGMGSGSICITQEQKGTGRGLATAIIDVVKARDEYRKTSGRYIPIIADGGIVHAKDISIALALGADCIMMGRYFARMEESPTEKVIVNSKVMKPYWGEGSPRAREWHAARYQQEKFAEGVEGYVEFAGKLKDNLDETLAKVKATMSSCGASNIDELHEKSVLELVSALSIREGQVHDIFLPGLDGPYSVRNWGA